MVDYPIRQRIGDSDDFNPKMRSTLSRTLRPMPSKASDIVENASHIIRGDIAGGAGGIVETIDIATHAVDRTKVFTGTDDEG